MFEKLKKWLSGVFICRVCGRLFYTMHFGFGECICGNCYNDELPFIFPDRTYWLNRRLKC